MAVGAGRGRRFVKQYEVAVDWLLQGVASRASYFLMTSLERKRSLFVIEERGLPLITVVAGGAVIRLCAKLQGMGILVAFAAGRRGALELYVAQGQLHIGRFMALRTGHGAMGAQQRKARLRVIKFRQVLPFPG